VTGVDLSPVQPTFIPPNCSFLVDDIENDWLYDEQFDFIHARFLSMGIRDWPRLFRQSFNAAKPGAWVEYQEAELIFTTEPNSPKSNPEMHALSDDVQEAAKKIGVDIRQAHGWKQAIEDAGFVNHHMVRMRWPLSDYRKEPKENAIGRMNRLNMLNGIEGQALGYLVRIRHLPPEEVRERLERVKREMRDPDVWQWMDL
jgi:hypothetical protein